MSGSLEAAARAIYAVWQGAGPDWTDDNLPDDETVEDAWEAAEAAYTAILDSLLGELPEEAVEAAVEAISNTSLQHRGDTLAETVVRAVLPAALRSLRDGLGAGR